MFFTISNRKRREKNYESGRGHHIDKEKKTIVLTSRRRPWLRKVKQPGNSISSVARKYEVHPDQLFKQPLVPVSEVENLLKQVRELQRLLGKKTMEVEILRDA